MRQVLTNLIGNAIKFTEAGEIVIRVTATRATGSRGPDTVIRFEVTDTGDGIAPDKLAMIFQPFVQADTSTSRKYGGTGLGLAISSQLVALMGGEVRRLQRAGGRKQLLVHDPGSRAADEAAVQRWSPDSDLAGVRALVVDDNATQRSILSDYLTRWGMRVDTADSAATALTALHAAADLGRPISVALVDQSMQRLNGVTLGPPSSPIRCSPPAWC